jgi:hypothetical protein
MLLVVTAETLVACHRDKNQTQALPLDRELHGKTVVQVKRWLVCANTMKQSVCAQGPSFLFHLKPCLMTGQNILHRNISSRQATKLCLVSFYIKL